MNDLDIPILKKTSELYKTIHEYRRAVPKHDRFTIYERGEELMLDIVEALLSAGYGSRDKKIMSLEHASTKLNVLRFFIRLMKETRAIDNKKYIALQEQIDEIGRMLGGWIRSTSK